MSDRLLEAVAIKDRSGWDKLSYSRTRIHLQVKITETYNVLYTQIMAMRYKLSRLNIKNYIQIKQS